MRHVFRRPSTGYGLRRLPTRKAWLLTLTDLRLALAARLEIVDDDWERPEDDDPRAANFGVYDWLTYLQESLVQSLIEGPTL